MAAMTAGANQFTISSKRWQREAAHDCRAHGVAAPASGHSNRLTTEL
jgi:hypothetical protein